MRFLSGNTVGGKGVGVGRIKTKEQNVQGGKRPNNTKVSGGGTAQEAGAGKKDG